MSTNQTLGLATPSASFFVAPSSKKSGVTTITAIKKSNIGISSLLMPIWPIKVASRCSQPYRQPDPDLQQAEKAETTLADEQLQVTDESISR